MNILLVGVLLVIGGVAVFFLPRQAVTKTAEQKTEPVRTEVPNPRAAYQTDTDGDGMPDWEERLRGTDPTRPDSPKVVQPEIIARLEEKRAETIATVAPVIAPLPTQSAVTPETTPTDTTVLRVFGNALGAALAPTLNESFEQETTARLNAAIASPDARSGLASAAAAYAAAAAALKEMRAPETAEALLASLGTGYELLARALAALARETASDPAQLGKAWLGYSDAVLEVGKALNETIGFFATRQIRFSPADPGALFNIN